MGELGEQSEALHASVGEHLKELHIHLLITIGTRSRAIHDAARKAAPSMQCIHYADLESFLTEAGRILEEGDAILVKASHYMEFQRIVSALSQ